VYAPDAFDELVAGDVVDIARRLLGDRVSTDFDGESTEVMLTEVEAYAGERDPASHAFRGRTPRNGSMFGPPGTLYVYRSYGIHWCMNLVVAETGTPHAILLRGGVPLTGRRVMEDRRGRTDHLVDGPGKLCGSLGVTGDHDGTSVLDGPVRLGPGRLPEGWQIAATPRVGISVARTQDWRFVASPPGEKLVLADISAR
jgi:DNA-3-methyladenine glycosylase